MQTGILGVLDGIGNIGTFVTGVAALFAIYKYIRSMAIPNEHLYGEEAEERFKEIKTSPVLKKAKRLDNVKYGGGKAFITPRLEINKLSFGSKIIAKDWKGRRAIIKYYEKKGKNEKGEPLIEIERWLI